MLDISKKPATRFSMEEALKAESLVIE